jgi:PAS domain S-box-containing protein
MADDTTSGDLLAREARYRAMFEASHELLGLLDLEGRLLECNPASLAALGVTLDAIRGKPFWEMPWWAHAAALGERLRAGVAQAASGQTVRFEASLDRPTPAGTWQHLAITLSPGRDEAGRIAYVVPVIHDLTERRHAEEHLRLLQTCVARLNDMVVITEAEPINEPGPRIVFVNESFERRTGYKREEVLGKTPRILQGQGTSRASLDRIRRALEHWQPVREELCNYTKDGQEFWVEIDIVPIADATGWYTHWVAVQRDVTERRKLEEQLLHAQKMEAVGRLAGGVAHDFNNLLTAIRASAELLREQLGPDTHGDLEEIERACARATDLTRRLLALGRRQVLAAQLLDVNAVVGDVQRMLSRIIGEDVSLAVELSPDLSAVRVDPGQLQQVLLNLAVNARDAMPSGGRLLVRTENVTLEAAEASARGVPPGRYVALLVKDDGAGMDETTRRRAFEPFFTTKEQGRGSGLGLSTVYGIVTQSGGAVTLDSAPGAGTTVTVYLPAQPERPSESGEAPTTPGREGARLPAAEKTVLVVEDEDAARRLLRRALTRMGYRVLEAPGGEEALELWRKHRREIDVVVTDVVMPGMSGRALVEHLRAEAKALPVVFISGYTEDALPDLAALGRRTTLLEKPFTLSALAERLRLVLGEKPPSP